MPARPRLEPADLGEPLPVAARWADVDTRRHVNNIAVHGLHLEARQRWCTRALGEAAFPHNPLLLRPLRVVTEFWDECHYPAPLQAGVRAQPRPDDRLQLLGGLFQHGRPLGLQQAVLQAWQADGVQPAPWPAGWAQPLAQAMLRRQGASELAPSLTQPLAGTAPAGAADAAHYPVHGPLASRYGDLDADGLCSELAVLRAIEQARALTLQAAFAAAGGDPLRDWVRLLVARIDLHCHHHRAPGASWQLAGALLHCGARSSAVLRVAVFDAAGQVLQAVADCVMVYTRPGDDAVAALPDALRQALVDLAWRGPPPPDTTA